MQSRRKATCFTIAVMALGLLLWARFILVTGHPRTATATPAQVASPDRSALDHKAAAPSAADLDRHVQVEDE